MAPSWRTIPDAKGRRSYVESTRLSAIECSSTMPIRCRSAGMWPTPNEINLRADVRVTSRPLSKTLPERGCRSPTRASTSSFWPLPSTPATPTISPDRISSSTPSTAAWRRSSSMTSCCSCITGLPGRAGFLSTCSMTGRPTINRARSGGLDSRGVVVATTLPWRITVIRSAISMTSRSLCVMKIIALPSLARLRRISNRPGASWGVRTAVGSSMISSRAPR